MEFSGTKNYISTEELSVAVKFLKDNGATHDVIHAESPMASLLENLPFDVDDQEKLHEDVMDWFQNIRPDNLPFYEVKNKSKEEE